MSTRKRWEYMFIDCRDDCVSDAVFGVDVIEELDDAGADGWEAVMVAANGKSTHRVLMKREVVDE